LGRATLTLTWPIFMTTTPYKNKYDQIICIIHFKYETQLLAISYF